MFTKNGAMIEKKSGKYSFFSNLLYHYKNLWKWEPVLFLAGFLELIPALLGNVLGNLLPAVVVEGLNQRWELSRYLGTLLFLAFSMWICGVLATLAEAYCFNSGAIYRQHYSGAYVKKKMDVDYSVLEDKKFQTHASASYTAIYQGRGINDAVSRLSGFLAYLAPAVFYAVLLARLNLWILVLALLCPVIQIRLLKLARTKHSQAHPVLSDLARRMSYLTSQSMDASAGKDIRLYHMADWLIKKYQDALEEMNQTYYRVHRWYMVRSTGDALLDLLRNGVVYGYLIWMTVSGKMTLTEFVLYFGFANSFSEYMFLALREALSFGVISNTFSSIREYFDTPERSREEGHIDGEMLEKIRRSPVMVTLKDVSFTYPGQEKPVISHMNLTVRPGEKLALIGLNGAGKTTLVKLICGFYAPTEGEILLNGIPIDKFARRQYYSLISALFQDYTILPMTVDENIASTTADEVDGERLTESLKESGFWERYDRLPNGGKSLLVKEIHADAVDFSGGEKQRLLFARALYKEAPLLILDEPTAALDPIAENEIYQKYGQATRGKTSIYISHRLSSTRFCDRIILLENGQIAESGTHAELMEKGGRYAELFEMQSRYYQEQETAEKKRRIMEEA